MYQYVGSAASGLSKFQNIWAVNQDLNQAYKHSRIEKHPLDCSHDKKLQSLQALHFDAHGFHE